MSNLESFCGMVFGDGYDAVLKKMENKIYGEFHIPKKSGYRTIHYLDKNSDLWGLQKMLQKNFLEKLPMPLCVKGFCKGENYHSFLSEHINSNYFLRLDISSFFSSIKKEQVQIELEHTLELFSDSDRKKISELICEITLLNDSLPQGACTSPAMSNLVMARVDQRITKYCQAVQVKYTRYADDLLFSSVAFNFKKKTWFVKKVKYILKSKGLKINYSKMKLAENMLCLNGYKVSKDGITLSRKRLRDIKQVLYFAGKNTELFHENNTTELLTQLNSLSLKYRDLQKYPFGSKFQFSQYLCGYRSFLISLLDECYSEVTFQRRLKELLVAIENLLDSLS